MTDQKYVDRPPRIQPELPMGTVDIPAPPRQEDTPQPLWQSLIPIITIVGYLAVSASGNGSNIAFILPMALAVFASTGLTIYTAIANRGRAREKAKSYQQRLVELRREMVASHNRQRMFYEYNYPEPDVVLKMRGDSRDSRAGTRLWERRSSDEDFGLIRLGRGTRPSTVIYKASERGEEDGGPLHQDAQRLDADSHSVTGTSVTVSLYQQPEKREKRRKGGGDGDDAEKKTASAPVSVSRHALGISGAPKDVYPFIYSLAANFSAYHSPADTQLFVLGMNAAAEHWGWAYTLPHVALNPSKGQYRLYFEDRERIYAPVDGLITELCVKSKETVKPGQVVARIREAKTGNVRDIITPTAGRVQEFGLIPVEGAAPKLVDANMVVKAGMLLMRLEDFELTMQQLEEEVDPDKDMQRTFGRKRKREVAGVPRFWKEKIWSELDRRARRLRDRDENDATNIQLPFMFIVVDLMAAQPDKPDDQNPLKQSWLEDLESEAAISLLMGQGAQLGATIIFLVPERAKIPSGCQAVIELRRDADSALKFLYAETGLNTTRYVGDADTAPEVKRLAEFASALAEWEVRRSYGADIPRSVDLMHLYDTNQITGLSIPQKWEQSTEVKRADWPKIPMGMMAGQEPRSLHFFADADGVHGMIAGSTGSGKSELLMTLILSLAIKYDPSVVNFVLIDFKGGAAFDPFHGLPHVVDIVTNLGGNAVARMFAAINAELNRRQRVNQDNDVKDIIRYRKAGMHLTRRDNYPHLFIIIDEFAEMISNNPEYKAQLDSITRLGRALGVSLILAAQRPTGVTDQMRANIKFRICLRVETREESSELLRLPDASYLPSIPGRGYLQVGSESLELIQVGYTGANYLKEDYHPLERYDSRDLIWEEDLGKEEDEPTYDVMVRRMKQLADAKYPTQAHRNWRKPWPSPLPTYITLDQQGSIEVDYIYEEDYDFIAADMEPNQPFCLTPTIPQWMDGGRTAWRGVQWQGRAMNAVVGILDDPANAQLHTLRVDFSTGHYMVLGASGWGKSTFLRSVIVSLLANHAPDELHLYMLDFGNRALQIFEEMPHTGAYIVSHERERVERLLRKVEQIIDERKEFISRANVANLFEYNALEARRKTRRDLPERLPALLVVVDNFAEFKESYEIQLDVLTPLVREGLATGVHFLITGEQTNAVGKLFNLVPNRITLKLSDDGEYASVLGRGARPIDEITGRGLYKVDRSILELQVALPLGAEDGDEAKSETDRLLELLAKLKQAGAEGNYPPPPKVIEQEKLVNLRQLLREVKPDVRPEAIQETSGPYFVMGRSDYDLSPVPLSLQQKLHFLVAGQPSTGKTTALQTMILSLADRFTPVEMGLVLVDYQGGLNDYGGRFRLEQLPHIIGGHVLSETGHLVDLVEQLENEYIRVTDRPARDIFVFIDSYEEIEELAPHSAPIDIRKRLGNLARRYGKSGLHFILGGLRTSFGSGDELVRPIAANRYGLAMDAETAESSPFYGSVPRSYTQSELPRGRGFIVVPGKVSPIQVAVPYADVTKRVDFMDEWLESITKRGMAPAEWLPMVEQPEADGAEAYPNGNGNGNGYSSNGASAAPRAALNPEQRAELIAQIERAQGIEPGTLADMYAGFDDETLLDMAQSYTVMSDGSLS